MIRPWLDQATRDHVRVAYGLDLLEAKLGGESIEFRKQQVEEVDEPGRRELRRQVGEADKIRKQNGRIRHVIGNHRLALVEPRYDQPGQDVQEQRLRLLLLDAQLLHDDPLAIPQPLLLDAGIDAGAEQDRIERLRHVVLGAGLDARRDAVDLVKRRDHNDRNVAMPLLALEPLKDLVAADPRHQQIEQDEIERLLVDELERLFAARGRHDFMPLAHQAPGQEIAVGLVIVDDENPAAHCKPAFRVRRRPRHPVERIEHRCPAIEPNCRRRIAVALGEVDERVDPCQQPLRGIEQLLQILDEDFGLRLRLLQQHLAVTLNGVERRAQIMPELRPQGVEVGAACPLGELPRIEQFIDEMLEGEAGLIHFGEVGSEVLQAVARSVLHQDLGISEDRSDRGAEVLADVREKGELQPVFPGCRTG